MRFTTTEIAGAIVVEPEFHRDDRGGFARIFCRQEFLDHGLTPAIEQANVSTNVRAGTVRGLHYQLPPAAEAKLVRCTRGSLFDVVVDLRQGSRTFGSWTGIELNADNHLALVIPEGCAHGFQTLSDDTTALYHVSAAYDTERERGVHHADPDIGIEWPLPVGSVSPRDAAMPRLSEIELPH